jgi:hypothetical protein
MDLAHRSGPLELSPSAPFQRQPAAVGDTSTQAARTADLPLAEWPTIAADLASGYKRRSLDRAE